MTQLMPPIRYEGYDRDAAMPCVWRRAISNSDVEILEIWNWSSGGWASHFAGVGPPSAEQCYIDEVIVTPERYFVQWFNEYTYREYVADVFEMGRVSDRGRRLTSDGSITGHRSWSNGTLFLAAEWPVTNSNAFQVAFEAGWGEYVVLPERWGCCAPDWSLREPVQGFPFVDWDNGPENVAFLRPNTDAFPDPPGTILGFLWVEPSETMLAHVDRGGTGSILWYDEVNRTWQTTAGFGTPSHIDFLGQYDSDSYLSVEDTTGKAVVRFDEVAKTGIPIATGLATVARGLQPFANGFLFTADDGVHGIELWFSDGTTTGTRMHADLRAGSAGSTPRDFVTLGEHTVFVTNDSGGLRMWSIQSLHLDWTRNPATGRFYRAIGPTSWIDAEREARNLGGNLATVRDQAEQDWLWSTFGPMNLWIGLQDFDRDGVFEWVSGEPVTYANWCPGEPNRSEPDEDVVHMAEYPGFCEGGWNDQEPTERYLAIVERTEAPAPVESFGDGCVNALGMVVAEARWIRGWPRLGGQVAFEFILGPGYYQTGLAVLGLDSTAVAGVPLPLDLAFAGAPGCSLYVSVDDALSLNEVTYSAPLTLSIPTSTSLIDNRIFVQGMGLNCCGPRIHTTNALRITITP